MSTIKISRDFSRTPGPRYIREGPYSGQAFRESLLRRAVRNAIASNETLEVDLDGVAGYGRSFLEESFGGLIREDHIPYDAIMKVLQIKSNEQPSQKTRVLSYLQAAHEQENLQVVSSA